MDREGKRISAVLNGMTPKERRKWMASNMRSAKKDYDKLDGMIAKLAGMEGDVTWK